MKPCEWVPTSLIDRAKYAGCPAYAVHGKRYCVPHLALIRGEVTGTPRVRREPSDADLLPLSQEEFASLRELRERSKPR